MSLKVRLAWAFVGVTLIGLLLAFVGLNAGMYATMVRMHQGDMMTHAQMMSGAAWLSSILRWSLLSTLAAFLVAGLTGYWFAGRITRSVSHLRNAALGLGLRDLSCRVPVEGDDEIADLARAFNRMCDRLEAEERARRQLLADIAHELRHPLAVMQGRLDLLQDGKEPLEIAALLPLEDEVLRLTRLVGDLRDLSLAEVGGLSLNQSRLDMAALLRDLLSAVEPMAAARSIQIRADLPEGLPPVEGDRDRLRQIFFNLLANAVQYTPPGGQVTVQARQGEGGALQVQVCDTGPGIAPEDLGRIFDRFYRADKSRSRATGGSGLGLAIVRSLVELHGGQVKAESREGEGACFTVTLPTLPPKNLHTGPVY